MLEKVGKIAGNPRMEELAQPARKTFRGGRRGRGRGRDRHGQQRRQAATAEAPRQEERAEEDEEGHDCARGEGEDQGADLEELLTQVANDRWVSSGSASSSHRWPHLAESPLGFEAENPAVELSADLFDLDLDALVSDTDTDTERERERERKSIGSSRAARWLTRRAL